MSWYIHSFYVCRATLTPLLDTTHVYYLSTASEGQLLIATRGDGAYTVAQTLIPTTTADYTPSLFCSSLGFSANGMSLAVGETGYGMGEGAVWMLQKTGRSGWAFVGSPITQRAPANTYAALGSSVAITKNYVLAGATGYAQPR